MKYLWQDDVADRLGPVERLVYRSNKLGEDLTLTKTGGGNTSSKIEERDPLTSEPVEVLWSGTVDQTSLMGGGVAEGPTCSRRTPRTVIRKARPGTRATSTSGCSGCR